MSHDPLCPPDFESDPPCYVCDAIAKAVPPLICLTGRECRPSNPCLIHQPPRATIRQIGRWSWKVTYRSGMLEHGFSRAWTHARARKKAQRWIERERRRLEAKERADATEYVYRGEA